MVSTPLVDASGERLRGWVRAIAHLLDGWHLEREDWYLADESVLGLQGYPAPPLEEADPRCIVHLDVDKLSFPLGDAEPLVPPAGTAERAAFERITQEDGVPLDLVPFTRHAIPITFRKTVVFDERPVSVASLRALGKIRLGEMVEALRHEGGMRPEEAARFRAMVPRLEALAAVDWSSRDRWFGKFCGELAALTAAIGEEDGPSAAKLNRLGRRHALV